MAAQMMEQIGAARLRQSCPFKHVDSKNNSEMPQRQLVLSQKRYGCFHSERVPSQAARRCSHRDVDYSRFLLVSESNGPLSHEPCPHQAATVSRCSMTLNDGTNTVKVAA